MNQTFRKTIMMLAAEVLLSTGATAQTSGATGSCTWALNAADSTLTVSGSGAMGDYAQEEAPWSASPSAIRAVVLAEGVTSVGAHAFYGCGQLATVALPASLTSVGAYAFCGCYKLASLTLPAGVTSVGSNAFYGCEGLKYILSLSPTPATGLTDGTFYPSAFHAELIAPPGASAAYAAAEQWQAFRNISEGGLYDGHLCRAHPNSRALGSVGASLSGGTLSLTATPANGQAFLGWASGGATLSTTPSISLGLAQDTSLVANFGTRTQHHLDVEGTLKDVPNIKAATHLTLTGALDARDVQLMRDSLPLLTELDLRGATVVGYYGAGGTMSPYTSSYYYDDNQMPWYSFCVGEKGKTSLTSVLLPEGLTSIGDGALRYCSGLTGALSLPEGVAYIGSEAFSNCRGLTGTLNLPAGLTDIGSYAFCNCSGLTGTLSLPAGLTSIGASTFYYCSGLTGALNLPEGVASIDDYAFDNCRGLSSVTLPERLGSIGGKAFYDCSGLTSVSNQNMYPQAISADVFGNVPLSSVTLRVPLVDKYLVADVWKDFGRIEGANLAALQADAARLRADSATLHAQVATLQALLSACQSSKPAAVAAPPLATLQAYPNPAGSELTIVGEWQAGDKAEVYTLGGVLVRTYSVAAGAEVSLDISALPQGTYLIKVGSKVGKMVKQ